MYTEIDFDKTHSMAMTFERAINYAPIFTLIQNLARASTTDGWFRAFEYDLHIIALSTKIGSRLAYQQRPI